MTIRHGVATIVIVLSVRLIAAGTAAGADWWAGSGEPGVITNNDCGFVSSVEGVPVIRRSFMSSEDKGLSAFAADRISAGDEIDVPGDSRLEIICGSNIILALGPGTRVKLQGVRSFTGPDGMPISRLDVLLERGEVRGQARLNERREILLLAVNGADVLLSRGDVDVFTDTGWNAIALEGEASARLRRGGVAGAPFALEPGVAFGSAGREALGTEDVAAIKARLPFSFEMISAALPPRPAAGSLLDAP